MEILDEYYDRPISSIVEITNLLPIVGLDYGLYYILCNYIEFNDIILLRIPKLLEQDERFVLIYEDYKKAIRGGRLFKGVYNIDYGMIVDKDTTFAEVFTKKLVKSSRK